MWQHLFQKLYQGLVEPRSQDPESRRHEHILNIILVGLTVVSYISSLAATLNVLRRGVASEFMFVVPTYSMALVATLLLVSSRKGKSKFAAIVIVGLLIVLATHLQLTWSFVLPSVPIMFLLAIIMSGVLFKARTALVVGGISSFATLIVAYLQVHHTLQPYTAWLNHPLEYIDAIGSALVFMVASLVTWLANREIDKSLERAIDSERALVKERDSLELKVVARTRELKDAQMMRIIELQKLSEYGRMGMSLLHDMANPITVASLHLEKLTTSPHQETIDQITNSVHHIEHYVRAARKQISSRGTITPFSLSEEITQVLNVLQYRIKQSRVVVEYNAKPDHKLVGDVVKFNQIIANLVINAIEAYEDQAQDQKDRKIFITHRQQKHHVLLTVQDWGKGIPVGIRTAIFEPFFSTKDQSKQNMGVGLSMVKRFIEEDFQGSIKLLSNKKSGTKFIIQLNNQEEIHVPRNHSTSNSSDKSRYSESGNS